MDDAHVPYLFIGLSLGLAALPEVPIFTSSKRVSGKIGNRGMIMAGGLVMVLKLVLFSSLTGAVSPLVFILVQSLHGVGWAFLTTGMVRFTDDLAHPRLRGTYQNLFQVPLTLGGALSSLFTAWIIRVLGSSWMMGIHGLIIFLALVYFFFFVRERN